MLEIEHPSIAEWRTGYRRFRAMPPHAAFPAVAWRRIVADAEAFCTCWMRQSAALGWTTLDLFGVDAIKRHQKPSRRRH